MEKKADILSLLTVGLLVTQTTLSIGIVVKLLERSNDFGNPAGPNVPDHVDGVSVDDDPYLGSPGAPITIVEFGDYECPFCAQAVEQITRILEEYDGMILYVYRDFPLPSHANAFSAALAAHCAGDQGKYWEMHRTLFANQEQLSPESLTTFAREIGMDEDQFEACLDTDKYQDEVNHDMQDGREYQVSGTPTFFVNGYRVIGGSYEALKQKIDSIIEEGVEPQS